MKAIESPRSIHRDYPLVQLVPETALYRLCGLAQQVEAFERLGIAVRLELHYRNELTLRQINGRFRQ